MSTKNATTDLILKNASSATKSNVTVTSNPPPINSSKLPPNAKVVGNYLLGKNIGQGTFGKVHLAMHLPTNEKVAIKLIDKKSMRPKDVFRVKNQIAILSQIRHRNIMHLYEIIQTQKSLLLVTEYLEQGQLFRQIIKQKKLNEEQACRYFQQIIDGVEYLHSNRIAHRDLKPENILIDYDGQLKIIDFGLSAQYAKNKELKSYCGSPCYAAPQIIEGKNSYNPLAADLWSCGVILFAMLSGHLPFCDPDTHTLYKKVVACMYKIPSHISAAAKDLIQNLLVKIPSKRLTVSDIRNHEWFNIVPTSKAYGIAKGEKLRVDYALVQRMQEMNMTSEKIVSCLSNGQVNKQTASYYIFMKKLVKNSEKMPAYIASDYFDLTFIERNNEKCTSDTEDISATAVIESASGPQMADESENVMAGSAPVWYKTLSQQEEKQMDEEELKKLTTGIFELVVSDLKKKDQITQLFDSEEGVDSKKKTLQDKKQSQFYGNNQKNRKSVRDLQLYKKIQLQIVQLSSVTYDVADKDRIIQQKSAQSTNKKSIRVKSTTKRSKRARSVKEPIPPVPQVWTKKQRRINKDLQKLIDTADIRFTKRMLPYLTLIRDSRLKQKINLIKNNSVHPHLKPVTK